jgi:CHAT domain-containing protein
LRNPSWQELLKRVGEYPPKDLFFACHGNFNPDSPATSRLWFGGPEGVSFSRVFSALDLPTCRSVIMGACESGLARVEILGEYIGLPSAFLAAGVRYTVGSLWKVNQLSTAILLDCFFEYLGNGQPLPTALNLAQREMMKLSRQQVITWVKERLTQFFSTLEPLLLQMDPQPFAHPDYWAGFYVSGDI